MVNLNIGDQNQNFGDLYWSCKVTIRGIIENSNYRYFGWFISYKSTFSPRLLREAIFFNRNGNEGIAMFAKDF